MEILSKTVREREFFEPIITQEYLDSGAEKAKELEEMGLFDFKKGKVKQIVKSVVLENTPYSLSIFSKNKHFLNPIYLHVVYNNGKLINRKKSGLKMKPVSFSPPQPHFNVLGDIYNNSEGNIFTKKPFIKNMNSIIAPYEDAICILLAKKTNQPVTRIIITSQKNNPFYVENLQERGFIAEEGEVEGLMAVKKYYLN